MSDKEQVNKIIKENDRRNEAIYAKFNPVTGEGSIGERTRVCISDFVMPVQWLPNTMMKIPFVKKLIHHGSIDKFLTNVLHVFPNDTDRQKVSKKLIRLRYKHDFAFWAATLAYIKAKGGGNDVLFKLNRAQRKLIEKFEKDRIAGKPIRLILLKARQWGGSTAIQMYFAWLQFIHKVGLNSLIIAHQGSTSDEIKDMFDRMIKEYPVELLHKMGEAYSDNEAKIVGVGKSGSIHRVPQRNCKIKIGTAERPDGCRGGDYNLVHLSEVGIWKATEGKTPEDIVRSACSGILYKPYTMIVMESTANGTGNFFHREYEAASDPHIPSQFDALFIAWFDIEQYSLPFNSHIELKAFAENLYLYRENANVMSPREESGKYLWWLWNKGATLEAIHWYMEERSGKNDHGVMASEYPSDDIEAFVHSGSMVFDRYQVEEFKPACRPPRFIGDVYGKLSEGEEALTGLRFHEDAQGLLWVWALPEEDDEVEITDRYLTVVDVGGRTEKADWSDIVVFDRINLMDGGRPAVVAEWYGHCDMDILAWKSAQIAGFYNNSLLVIESNTMDSRDKERHVEGGDQSLYILNQIGSVYPNMYARRQSEDEIRQGLPKKYGFNTNPATKPMIISTLIKCVRERLYTERDMRALDELLVYEKKQNGSYGAISGRHDDKVMTRAIGMHICFYEMDMPTIVDRKERGLHYHRGPMTAATI